MRVFVVVEPVGAGGPELVRILLEAGARPEGENQAEAVVLHREVSGDWRAGGSRLDIPRLIRSFAGDTVTLLLMARDPSALAREQVELGVVPGRLEAEANIRAVYTLFFSSLAGQGVDWHLVPLEALERGAPALLARLGLSASFRAPLQEVA